MDVCIKIVTKVLYPIPGNLAVMEVKFDLITSLQGLNLCILRKFAEKMYKDCEDERMIFPK